MYAHLNGVIVCINFDDFLATTLPMNRRHFDRLVIVTTRGPDDKPTRIVARRNDCKLVYSERYCEMSTFNKGKAINDGLAHCSQRGWACVLDADIVLPNDFGRWVGSLPGSSGVKYDWQRTLFGLHRWMCSDWREWREYLRTGNHHWALDKLRSWCQLPAGYLQLWYAATMHVRYPENYPDDPDPRGGYHGDLAFGRQFPYRYHPLEPRVIHLATKTAASADRLGRTSMRWGRP